MLLQRAVSGEVVPKRRLVVVDDVVCILCWILMVGIDKNNMSATSAYLENMNGQLSFYLF